MAFEGVPASLSLFVVEEKLASELAVRSVSASANLLGHLLASASADQLASASVSASVLRSAH